MKTKVLLSLVMSLAIVGISNARYSVSAKAPNLADIQARARQLIQSAAASDTITIPGGIGNEGLLEQTINADTTKGVGRTNTKRVYKLQKNQYYIQYSGINIKNPTGKLTIVGEKGGTKPVCLLAALNAVDPGMNLVTGSIKLDNVYMCSKVTTDNFLNNNLFVGSTANSLPQTLEVNNCLIEFINLDCFSIDAWNSGVKIKITNSYFRNLFYSAQWWGGRVWYCKQAIDTVWVENTTVTGGGLIFLNQNSLTKFAYYNHNTIINSNKYWQLGVYYLEGYWVNNLFINQNWVGEDMENVATGGQDPDKGMLFGTMSLDTLTQVGGSKTAHINIQAEFLKADGTVDESKCGLDKIKAFISNNVQYTDTILNAYFKNYKNKYNSVGPYPVSYLTWMGLAGPFKILNVPGIWMNQRTKALIDAYPNMIETDNYVEKEVKTVTPAIKDMSVVDQMAWWNDVQWGLPGVHANDITHSAYIFGDVDPNTIPGVKTEDGDGITKFTDLNENFSQTGGTIYTSKIDGFPIGALIWDDAKLASYNSADAFQKVKTAFVGAQTVPSFTDDFSSGVVAPFQTDDTAKDLFPLSIVSGVLQVAYKRIATSDSWGSFSLISAPSVKAGAGGVITFKIKSSIAFQLAVKPIYSDVSGSSDWNTRNVAGDNAWHDIQCLLGTNSATYSVTRIYFYINGGSTTVESGTVQIDDFYMGAPKTGVEENVHQALEFSLSQNYPNPFNPSTSLKYSLPHTSDVRIVVYNTLGKEIRTLVDGKMQAGSFLVTWDGSDNAGLKVPSGIYFYKMVTTEFTKIQKMTLLK
jgi:hypothetical protein